MLYLLCRWLLLRHRAPLWVPAEAVDEEPLWEPYLAAKEHYQVAPLHRLALAGCLLERCRASALAPLEPLSSDVPLAYSLQALAALGSLQMHGSSCERRQANSMASSRLESASPRTVIE